MIKYRMVTRRCAECLGKNIKSLDKWANLLPGITPAGPAKCRDCKKVVETVLKRDEKPTIFK